MPTVADDTAQLQDFISTHSSIKLMSLKGFHILFITLSTLLCVFVVLWAFVLTAHADTALRIFGGVCAVIGVILPVYGVNFYRKSREY